jgi:hypothetical protein
MRIHETSLRRLETCLLAMNRIQNKSALPPPNPISAHCMEPNINNNDPMVHPPFRQGRLFYHGKEQKMVSELGKNQPPQTE